MSHLSKIELEVKDLDTLGRACLLIGLNLVKGKQNFKWYYGEEKCDHAIEVPGAEFEIGVISKDGMYELATDFWDLNVEKAIGKNGGLLKQRYAVEKTKAEARRKGYRVIEKQADNKIRLHVRL